MWVDCYHVFYAFQEDDSEGFFVDCFAVVEDSKRQVDDILSIMEGQKGISTQSSIFLSQKCNQMTTDFSLFMLNLDLDLIIPFLSLTLFLLDVLPTIIFQKSKHSFKQSLYSLHCIIEMLIIRMFRY